METKELYYDELMEQAEVITAALQDSVPLIRWQAEYDSYMVGFRIKGTLTVGTLPLNVACILSTRHYESGRWLEQISYNIVHGIAELILKGNRP